MSYLIDLWSEKIDDPVNDFNSLAENFKEFSRHLHGININNLPPPWSPLLLLWKNNVFYKKVLEIFLAHGVDMDQAGEQGFNVLYIIIIYIFHNPRAIQHLEWWLKMGCNPNYKLVWKDQVLLPLEFFLLLESTEKWNSHDLISNIEKFEKRTLEPDEIEHVILLFLCFQTEMPVHYSHTLLENYLQLELKDVTKTRMEKFPILESKLFDYYKMPKELANFWTRHQYLSKNFNHFRKNKYKASFSQELDIIINPYFCLDEITPKEQYIEYFDGSKNFYFIASMIPSILKTGINPCTNQPIPLEIKMSWVEQLDNGIFFPYKSLEENLEIFPLVFQCPKKTSNVQSLLEILNKIISKIHPYTNIMNIRNWKKFAIQYATTILEDPPYFITELKNVDQHEKFLMILVKYLYADLETNANKIHFGIEDITEDLKLYHLCQKFFHESGQAFTFSFFEAILNTEIYNLLKDRIGYYSFYDMGHTWYRICTIYYIEHDITEDTSIMLIQ